jgi:hypothetical protein
MENNIKALGFWPYALGIGGQMISSQLPVNFEYIDSRAPGLIGLLNAVEEHRPDVLLCDFGPLDPLAFDHFKELRKKHSMLAVVLCEITVFNRRWKKYAEELQFVYYDMGPKWDLSGISTATAKAKAKELLF